MNVEMDKLRSVIAVARESIRLCFSGNKGVGGWQGNFGWRRSCSAMELNHRRKGQDPPLADAGDQTATGPAELL